MAKDSGILLESGTNELEIVEFEVAGNRYGINVIKVKEIIVPMPITPIPHADPAVEGIIQLRGDVLPVISMECVLGMGPSDNPQNDKYIVSSFNKQQVVFHVHNVTMIHRISWDAIEKPSGAYSAETSPVIGVIKLSGEMLLLLDFEKIVMEISPDTGIRVEQIQKLGKRERSDKRLLVAEDSPMLRKLLHTTLSEAGYDRVEFFENGKDALEYLENAAEQGDIEDTVQLVITDIEMPQMDGHHFTRRIRGNKALAKLPVIIFSSLITEELKHKGTSVGADDQVSKPEIAELVLKIDQYVL
ncbi:chemotaxis protein [Sporosarcina trichiuri]|uniref:chemotaxis protein n=1 Tax=Sporosarcina trichiuri TaxID=3056445 RepID=UPI0025B45307|nr:chemotaxis protein [Sporosarcina sp. 0.2-SM1T-5]WJY26641.1 chemotaxis protein [Sporosarcina sp. 0.2-SM1T-5]